MLDSSKIIYEDDYIVITEYSELFNTDTKLLFQLKEPSLNNKNLINKLILSYREEINLKQYTNIISDILSIVNRSAVYNNLNISESII